VVAQACCRDWKALQTSTVVALAMLLIGFVTTK
jgi:hypothetical protein